MGRRQDLVGYRSLGDEEEVAGFVEVVSAVIEKMPEGHRLSEEMAEVIDRLLFESSTSGWHMPLIGSYQDLLQRNSSWVQTLREDFKR